MTRSHADHDHGPDEPGPRDPRAFELTAEALRAALADDTAAAVAALQAVGDETGPDGVMDAILLLCDTYICRSGVPEGRFVVPAWRLEGSDEITGPEPAPAEYQWAGRLLAARANDDYDGFMGLVRAVPEDPKAVGDHVHALLFSVALGLRQVTA